MSQEVPERVSQEVLERPGPAGDRPTPVVLRPPCGREPIQAAVVGFSLTTELPGGLAAARWTPDTFECDPSLLGLAEIVEALGEVVEFPGGGEPIRTTTSADQPIALLCTLIRAAGPIRDCRVDLAGSEPPDRLT